MNIASDFEDYIILLVDDNPSNLRVLADYLEGCGFTIRVATNGEITLQRAVRIQPALILLDVMMPPGIDGFETCRRLKADERTKDIPVIFMTALNSTEDKVTGFEVGAVDYITKPIQHEEVLARVTTHLRLRDLTLKLQQQNQKILILNERLKQENLRMSAELDVAKQLQQMVLPKEEELQKIKNLDIAGFMEPADDVGGDYYDVLEHEGRVKIGIGDVTGHGLESGVVMLMVQTAVQALLTIDINDPEAFLIFLNCTLYKNIKRIETDKNLTLSLLDYQSLTSSSSTPEARGILRVTGQHEDVLVVRQNGQIERVNTINLGLIVGMVPNIANFVSHADIQLQQGDGIVLYTDGITEARNLEKKFYQVERLCEVVTRNWHKTAKEIQQTIITDVRKFIGEQKVFDDITLLVLKQQ